MRPLAALAAAALLLLAGEAQACMTDEADEALIHSALPTPLPAGAIIADVAFEGEGQDEGSVFGTGERVRVRRMIQGDYRGSVLIVRARTLSSCDAPFVNGRAGLIVGIPVGSEGGVPIVAPVRAIRSEGFRLRDGYRLPRPGDGGIRLDP